MYPIADFGYWMLKFNEIASHVETGSFNLLSLIFFIAFFFMSMKMLIVATEKVVSIVVYSVLSIIPALVVLNVCIKDGHNICTAEQLNTTMGEIVSFLNSTLNR